MNEHFMKSAIEEAKKSSEKIKCGAVIAKDGKIIGKGFNSQRKDNDATAHAEINAIREAGKNLNSKNLEGCIIYCTCEPCTMCLSAIIISRISRIVCSGISIKEAFGEGAALSGITLENFLKLSGANIELENNFMKEICKNELYS